MNHNPYSHSKISCYEECPYKFKARYLDKLKIAADPKHFEKGNYYHWILEHYPNVPPDAPFVWKFNGPEKQKEFEVYIRTFLKNPRTQYLLRNCKSLREYEFQVHGDLEKQIAEKANKWISLCWGYIDLMAIDLKEPKNLILIEVLSLPTIVVFSSSTILFGVPASSIFAIFLIPLLTSNTCSHCLHW